MNCTIFSYEKTMGIRKLGGDNTEKKKLQTYVQIIRIKEMIKRETSLQERQQQKSRTTLDFQGQPTRNVISQIVQ